MSELARRLAGLRQQSGAPQIGRPAPIGARTASSNSGPAGQLRKLLNLRPAPIPLRPRNLDRSLVGEEIARGLWFVEKRFAADMPDTLELGELGFQQTPTRSLLAFDTETTGLAGGTGTRAFMIGVAQWRGGELGIRQLYLSSLAAETAMLRMFSSWLAEDTVLVSYNGKCYDRPLLSTRFRLASLPDPLIARPHIDLLHPMRRRYRGIWPNCKLATAERELLRVHREDDLPGAEAPAAWLNYLRGGSADKLRRVAVHNEQDMRSLWGLMEWFHRRQLEGDVGRDPKESRAH